MKPVGGLVNSWSCGVDPPLSGRTEGPPLSCLLRRGSCSPSLRCSCVVGLRSASDTAVVLQIQEIKGLALMLFLFCFTGAMGSSIWQSTHDMFRKEVLYVARFSLLHRRVRSLALRYFDVFFCCLQRFASGKIFGRSVCHFNICQQLLNFLCVSFRLFCISSLRFALPLCFDFRLFCAADPDAKHRPGVGLPDPVFLLPPPPLRFRAHLALRQPEFYQILSGACFVCAYSTAVKCEWRAWRVALRFVGARFTPRG